ncbi:MAG: phosphatidate cytidylyltransferase [Clostridia bacterium]|nr:phosphatidate cytidylyltransferase [Clostridia bacterium]
MLKRIITAVVAIAIFLPVLYFSETIVFPIVMALLSLIGCFEMLRCTELIKKYALSVPMLGLSLALPLLPYWYDSATVEHVCLMALIVLALYLFTIMTFSRGKITLANVGSAYLSCFYIIVAFMALSLLRYRVAAGEYVYLICFIGAWVTDTFAYFSGFLFGKHKLIPDVSPKKTIEGSVGGTLFCVLAMVGYGWIVQLVSGGSVTANYLTLAVSGLFIAVVAQVGDLLMSAVKRTYGIKDYGKLFPGHGGVLDRFDSVLAVALVLIVISSVSNLFLVA